MIYAEILLKDLKNYEITFYGEKSYKEDVLWDKRVQELMNNEIVVESLSGNRGFILNYLATRDFIPVGQELFYKR